MARQSVAESPRLLCAVVVAGNRTLSAVALGLVIAGGDALNAHASLMTNGMASVTNVGDAISDTMLVDGEVVNHTLKLTAITSPWDIYWNGTARSGPHGLTWDDRPGDWTIELTLSRAVNFVISQTGDSGHANEPYSRWTIDWDSVGAAAISDPGNQLDEEIAGAGTATISTSLRTFNPGTGNANDAKWSVSGADTMKYTIPGSPEDCAGNRAQQPRGESSTQPGRGTARGRAF